MTPLVEQRIGAASTAAWKRWAFHPQLRIMYVNTFARVGASSDRVSEPDDSSTSSRRQRAHRAFSDAPVSDDGHRRACSKPRRTRRARRTGSRGSSSSSATRTRRAAIGDLTRRAWETGGRAFSEGRLSPKLLADVERGATGGVAGAPVHIVVCADIERGLEQTVPSSIFPAVQNLLLAATALGLGSALTTITVGYRDELRALLGLPDHVVPVAVVPLGHPPRARSGHPAATRSRRTRTASGTASPGRR